MDNLSLSHLLVAVTLLYTGYTFLIYPFFLSPMRNLPRAHWSVPFPYIGSIWILSQRLQCRGNAATYNVHSRLGPVVRLGDNEISVNCYDGGLRTIYMGGWEKHEFYPRLFINFGAMNMVSTIGHRAHAQKKRILANIYSKSYIHNSDQIESNSRELLFKRCLPLIESLALSQESCDVLELSSAFGMDFMTAYLFGISRSTNFIQDVELRRKYLQAFNSLRSWQLLTAEIHPFLENMTQKFGLSLFPRRIHEASALVADFTLGLCKKADEHLLLDSPSEKRNTVGSDQPVVLKQYREGLVKLREQDPAAGKEEHPYLTRSEQPMCEKEIDTPESAHDAMTILEVYSEMGDQILAGHDTTAVTMTYLYHELSKHPEAQDRLATEVRTLSPPIRWPSETTGLPTAKEIDSLPYLNAVILETLRLRSPVPGPLARVTPSVPGGSSIGPLNTAHHYNGIPAGVRVSAMSYAIHRIPTIFTEADVFKPDRWLTTSQGGYTNQDELTEMNRHFWAFGSGGRMCIGSHFALHKIKLLLTAIYGNYRTEIVDDNGIEQVDTFNTYPKSGRLIIRFVKR